MLKKLIITTAAAGILTMASMAPSAAFNEESYLGSVHLVGYNFCPRGTVEARGQLIQIRDNPSLFSLYGTYYGGDGRNNFALPDLRNKVPAAKMRYCVVVRGRFPSRT